MKSKFLDHGEISLGLVDKTTRQLILKIRAPYFILFGSLHVLSKAGMVGEVRVMNPLTSWFPFSEKPELHQIQETIRSSLEVYLVLKNSLRKSGLEKLAFPILPTGVYVDVEYRCKIDEFIPILADWKPTEVYKKEFQWAMTETLAHAIGLFESA